MALTRAMLKGMGLTEEQVGAIIEEHTTTIDGLKKTRDEFKADAEKLKEAQTALQKELRELKKAAEDGSTVSKAEYDKVIGERDDFKTKYDEYVAEQTAKESERVKKDAYKALLKEAGISDKHIDSVLRVSDISKLEMGEDGKFKDSDKVLDGVKTEWSDFISTTKTLGAGTETPPANIGGNSNAPSRATAMTRRYRENLYGAIKEE